MSKVWELNQELSDIIYLFFSGDINKITKTGVEKIYDDPKINKNFKVINLDDKKQLLSIIKKNKKDYRIILKAEKNKEDIEDIEIEDIKVDNKIIDDFSIIDEKDKYMSFQRKAFIKWINDTFYKNIISVTKNNNLKIYQNFVKEYLSINTPYRGLLVYHGLGTGKTATAISAAEGLSVNMKITTLLPASLETNFVNEVKKFGEELFDENSKNWLLITEDELLDDIDLRTKLFDRYNVTMDIINKIYNKANKVTSGKINKGIWVIADTEELKERKKQIDIEKNKLKESDKSEYEIQEDNEKKYINIQITQYIKLKYNFIHYNPFPKVKTTNIEQFKYKTDEDKSILYEDNVDEEQKTDNAKIVKKLEDKLQENIEKYNINSPFYNEVIIIDEIHNFVRQIINNSGPSRVFYEWIMNSKNIKLICLSGTPIINKPCEIAVLFNMIRGMTKQYNFIVNTGDESSEILDKLKTVFYEKNTSINQINVSKISGKVCLSFTGNDTRFESILDPDNNYIYTIKHNEHNFEEFIGEIFDGLNKLFGKEKIIPSESQFKKLPDTELANIIRGNERVFDKVTKKVFNLYRPLFTINYEGIDIDLTNNDKFMEYFFNDSNDIPTIKKTLLKRMLLGLISYYPIDRSSITTMPEIIMPTNDKYNEYNISEKIQIELCEMSAIQFNKYEGVWLSEKERAIRMNNKKMYSDTNFDYNIRTRQACNMVYNNDKFRQDVRDKSNDDIRKEKDAEYKSLTDGGVLIMNEGLEEYSPKFNKILNNLSKFVDSSDKPTGKILFYSEFRSDAGSEIFEVILNANGYKRYDPNDTNKGPALRYTFITGEEKDEERKANQKAFNEVENKTGEFIQIMIISGAGAEGISLTCVRQVHILEPYWNYVRIDQVFGRAIRMNSHSELPPDDRTVEQYLYISSFPDGETYDDIYDSIKKSDIIINEEKKRNLDKLESLAIDKLSIDLKKEGKPIDVQKMIKTSEYQNTIKDLVSKNEKDTYDLINKIFRIKNETRNSTADQNLLDIMERKYIISQKITDLIKESSVDCLQNTRDDYRINQGCIQFDPKLLDENSYFPGISAETLNRIDEKQLVSDFSYFIEPDIYIISATETMNDIDNKVYLYIKLNKDNLKEDIRYIRDNGKILGKFDISQGLYLKYFFEENELDKSLGTKFSLFQSIYNIPVDILDEMKEEVPRFSKDNNISTEENLIGYKVKFNIDEQFYYMQNNDTIKRLYDYGAVQYNNFDLEQIYDDCIIIYNKKIYESIRK